jgi:translocator protein
MTPRAATVLTALAWVALCEAVGVVGALVTRPAIPVWYAALRKPALAPPNWVFGPVWTALFVAMGIAAFLVWRAGWRAPAVRQALWLFGLQLGLNALWSILFFGQRAPGAALVDIVALWLAIAATIAAFARVSRSAAWLLVPYLLWVSFAVYLNAMIWWLN